MKHPIRVRYGRMESRQPFGGYCRCAKPLVTNVEDTAMIPDEIADAWAYRQVPEADCIAIIAALDNEIERAKRLRERIASTYMVRPFVLATPAPKPLFTFRDAIVELVTRRRANDKNLINMLQRIGESMRKGETSCHAHPLSSKDQQPFPGDAA